MLERARPGKDLLFAAGAAVFSGAALALCLRFGDGLGASDPWRHIRWAFLLRAAPPGALREWPVFTVLAKERVDLWALYHRLLIPFTFGNLETGVRAAAVFYGALSLGALAYALRRLNARAAPACFLGALALTPFLFSRALQARPSPLADALLALSALCAVEGWALGALACAWAHAALHISFILQGLLAAAALLAYRRSPRALRYAAAVGAGAALGTLARPHAAAYVRAALAQGLAPFRASAGGFDDLGLELYPPGAALLLAGLPVFLAAGWAALRLRRDAGARPAADRLFLVLAAAAFCALAAGARRFFAPAGALAALALCACLPERDPLSGSGRRRLALAVLCAAFAGQVVWAAAGLPTPYGSRALRGAARILRERVAPGEVVFNDDWRSWAKLFFHDPTHRYVAGCDPTLMLAAGERRFWLWRHLSFDAAACDRPALSACPPGDRSPQAVREGLRSFDAAAVVVSGAGRHPALERVLAGAPKLFAPLGCAGGTCVYAVDAR